MMERPRAHDVRKLARKFADRITEALGRNPANLPVHLVFVFHDSIPAVGTVFEAVFDLLSDEHAWARPCWDSWPAPSKKARYALSFVPCFNDTHGRSPMTDAIYEAKMDAFHAAIKHGTRFPIMLVNF